MEITGNIKFDTNGLITAVVQHAVTLKVLMLGYMNREALEKTISTGTVWFYSRSRQTLWNKGETSGNFLNTVSIDIDCDKDALLIRALPLGPTCHTNNESCFFTSLYHQEDTDIASTEILAKLYRIISARQAQPKEGSYTTYLFEQGIDKILKKVGEEAAEVIIAAKNDAPDEITYEVADLIYHLVVMLKDRDVSPAAILKELEVRFGS